jgi:predicted SnoaL-like aldol condensation-catalyzing enzyme
MNKEAAISFLTLVTAGKIQEAYARHVAPTFKHHNAFYKGDAESLKKGMEENELQFPGKIFKVHHALAEGDLVCTHSHVKLKSGELEFAVVHVFRFEGGKIVELWDVGQQIPADSLNANGMF